jgi:hypothetical protein
MPLAARHDDPARTAPTDSAADAFRRGGLPERPPRPLPNPRGGRTPFAADNNERSRKYWAGNASAASQDVESANETISKARVNKTRTMPDYEMQLFECKWNML